MRSAVRTAVHRAASFHSMPYDTAAAVFTLGSQRLNGTFKAVKGVSVAVHVNIKRFVIIVATGFTFHHRILHSLDIRSAFRCGSALHTPYPIISL